MPEGSANTSLSRFSDANQIADYAQEAIQKLADHEIITGSGGTGAVQSPL
ncbi:S-layer homology domain-containing protein [Paenibacillus sp. Leaf72]